MSQQIEVVAAVIRRDDQVLLAQRPKGKHLEGLWEFPGGKVESTESYEEALVRECEEELDITLENLELIHSVRFEYPEKTVLIRFFMSLSFKGEPKGLEGQPLKWCLIDDLQPDWFPAANREVIKILQKDY